jgi:hypothetical protein
MKTYFQFLVVVFLLFIFWGCSNLLPSSKAIIISPWQDFDSAKADYEKIIPGQTTIEELNKIGFSPFTGPNIRILNATDTINIFMQSPSIKIEDLDPGVQKCAEVKTRCTSYKIEPSILQTQRIGNFWLDILQFKRHTKATGWEFRGLIVIIDNVVVYKDPVGGRPTIHTEEIQNKPLGPLQDSADVIPVTRALLF